VIHLPPGPVYTSEPNLALGKQDFFIPVARIDQFNQSFKAIVANPSGIGLVDLTSVAGLYT
jgi:hypothetical protein